ncbi:MAG TPA: phage recombination protein Bet [Steroidobacteraceae bacterium]|nr:phage recombination protein Bet [Steroidobacteraceae bacterium]
MNDPQPQSQSVFQLPVPVQPQVPIAFNAEQIQLIKDQVAVGATDSELKLFLYQCRRTGLDPLARQIYFVPRWVNVRDEKGKWTRKRKMTIQTSIDGFRLIAERTGKYAGQLGPYWCGLDGVWREVWLDAEPPAAARVAILRPDFREPLWAVALWNAYVQKTDKGITKQWLQMGPLMIGKCAEALALRRGFPQELSGLYTDDEMAQASASDESAEPVAREDVMRPTSPGPGTKEADWQAASVSAPGSAGTASTTSTTTDKNPTLTIPEVQEIERMARQAADSGSEALGLYFKTLRTLNKQLVFKGLAGELVKRRNAADLAIAAAAEAQGEANNEAQEAKEWIDEETGEVHSA